MKKVYLIHGWGENSEDSWFPWIRGELEKKGVDVTVFDMPNSNFPVMEQWVKHLEENVKEIDEETYLFGHSIGCQTIIRFLEKLHKYKRVGGCFFVAPWFNLINLEPEEMEIAHPWINTKTDFSRINEHCDNFLSLFSDNDPFVPESDHKIFEEKLGSKIIIEKGARHFEKKEEPVILREALKFLHVK
jgi:hypothetical protein